MKRYRILLADDDEDDIAFFRQFLKTRTHTELFGIAEDGDQVFGLLQKVADDDLPTFLILDQNMPKLNGMQTLLRLKGDERLRHLPVFIYSTYADESLRKSAKAAGAADIISKPDNINGYSEMLDVMIERVEAAY